MPYTSKAQQGYFHAHPEKVGGPAVVAEFDRASRGRTNLPAHVRREHPVDARRKARHHENLRQMRDGRAADYHHPDEHGG